MSAPLSILYLTSEIPKAKILPPVFHPIHLKAHKHWIPVVGAVRFSSGLPYLAAKWISPRVGGAIARALRRERFDAVYIDHLGMTAYLPLIRRLSRGARVVLEQHNVESDFFKQFAARKTGAIAHAAQLEWKSAARFEAKMLSEVDSVVAISDADHDTFKSMAKGVRSRVVPQVVTFKRKPWSEKSAPRLAYVGNLGWFPNVEGLDWLAEEVWPIVRAKDPRITLRIGGSGLKTDASGKPVVPEKWKRDGIECVGFVEDLDAFYADATTFLAPILSGSGVRIKVLEAFRAGMPLVTTVEGALGLPVVHEKHAMVARTKEEFADAIIRVSTSDALQRTLREGGYAYLEEQHGLTKAQAIMRDVLGAVS